MLNGMGEQVPSIQSIMLAGMTGSSGMSGMGASPFLAMRKVASAIKKTITGPPPTPAALAKQAQAKKAVRSANRDERVKEAVGLVAKKNQAAKLKEEKKRIQAQKQDEMNKVQLKAAKEAYSMAKTIEKQNPGYMVTFVGTAKTQGPLPGFGWKAKSSKEIVPLTMPAKDLFKRAMQAMKNQEKMLAEHARIDQEIAATEQKIISSPAMIEASLPILPEVRTADEIAAQSVAVAKEVLSNWGLPPDRGNAQAVAQEVAVQMQSAIAREGAVAAAERALHEQKAQVIDEAWGKVAIGGSWY